MQNIRNRIILDLCGGTGGWSRPYVEAGYKVVTVDPLAEKNGMNFCGTVQEFYADLERENKCFPHFHGVLFGPPCTEFAGSGARWWKKKNPQLLIDAIEVVRVGLQLIERVNPVWWVMENPVGRLARMVPEIGKCKMYFHPCYFGDPYTKYTGLWGEFNMNLKQNYVSPTEGSKMHKLPPGPDRWRLRSVTPPGFAKAFFGANP